MSNLTELANVVSDFKRQHPSLKDVDDYRILKAVKDYGVLREFEPQILAGSMIISPTLLAAKGQGGRRPVEVVDNGCKNCCGLFRRARTPSLPIA